jgi:hypothetical protein
MKLRELYSFELSSTPTMAILHGMLSGGDKAKHKHKG